MSPSAHVRLVVGLLVAAVAVSGCLSIPPEEAEDAGDTQTETRINVAATPEEPVAAGVAVTDGISSVKLDISLTYLSNVSENPADTAHATVVVLVGNEEVMNETYELSAAYNSTTEDAEGVAPDSPNKATVVQRDFGDEYIQMALREDAPNRAFQLLVTVDHGPVSVDGYLRANQAL